MQGIIKYYLPMSNGFLTWVYEEMNRREWRSADLARRSGLSDSTISRVFSRERLPSWDFCAGVARAFNLRAEEVFRIAGLLPAPAQETAEEEELTYLFRRLNPDRREAALHMLRGLVQGMSGHYTFMPAGETDLTIEVYREIIDLADQDLYFDAVLKLLANTTTEQQLAISRKLDELDAEEDAAHEAGVTLGGSRTM